MPLVSALPISLQGPFASQAHNFAFAFVELHEVPGRPHHQPVQGLAALSFNILTFALDWRFPTFFSCCASLETTEKSKCSLSTSSASSHSI